MKILFVKTSSLGDIIHSFRAIEYVNKLLKKKVDWVVEEKFASLLYSHPGVSQVFPINTKAWRHGKQLKGLIHFLQIMRKKQYDVVFDLQGNVKSALITMAARGKKKVGFGWKTTAEWPNVLATNFKINPPQELDVHSFNLYLVQNFFKKPVCFEETPLFLRLKPKEQIVLTQILQETPYENKDAKIMVCPGAFWKNKEMTQQALMQFLKKIYQSMPSHFFCTWGSDREKATCQEIQRCFKKCKPVGKLPLQILQNLMHRMDLVIAMDSMPLHLAATTKTPTFSIFGPSSSKYYAPKKKWDRSFQGKCPYAVKFDKRCPFLRSCSTGACLRSLEGSEVFSLFEKEYLKLLWKSQSSSE